jgi:putative PIG3 family NAD(P)H quinone oxidoreductase
VRAAVIAAFGDTNVLDVREIDDPAPRAGEVLVRVRAAGLNRADILQRRGKYPAPAGAPSLIPGLELAGEVVATAPDAKRWSIGDRVFGIVAGGAHAELAAVHETNLARVPDGWSWEDAGATPEAFVTAHDALITQARLARDERVLVHAVGSGVGIAVLHVAKSVGALVFGTARTADKIDRARALGMDAGLVTTADLAPLVAAIDEWSGRHGVDVIADLVGGPYVEADVRCAAPRGRIMLIGSVAGPNASFPMGLVLSKRLTLTGTVLRARSTEEKAQAVAGFERDVVPMLADASRRLPIDSVYSLDDIRAAHERLESNETFGKVVLRLNG